MVRIYLMFLMSCGLVDAIRRVDPDAQKASGLVESKSEEETVADDIVSKANDVPGEKPGWIGEKIGQLKTWTSRNAPWFYQEFDQKPSKLKKKADTKKADTMKKGKGKQVGQGIDKLNDKGTADEASKDEAHVEAFPMRPSVQTSWLMGAALITTIIFGLWIMRRDHAEGKKVKHFMQGSGLSTSSSDVASSETGSTDRELKSRMARFEQRLEDHKKRLDQASPGDAASVPEGLSKEIAKMKIARSLQKV